MKNEYAMAVIAETEKMIEDLEAAIEKQEKELDNYNEEEHNNG